MRGAVVKVVIDQVELENGKIWTRTKLGPYQSGWVKTSEI